MEHIAGAFYINLDRREDRRAEFEEECKKMSINVERFSAIAEPWPFHDVGCHKSHLEVLKKARALGLSNVLIFEDDFTFIISKEEFESNLRNFFDSNIPYDVVMLSYLLNAGESMNETVGRVKEAQTASGYIVHSRFFDRLIDNLETNLTKLIETRRHWLHLNDQCWKQLQPGSEWFYFKTRIGVQRPSMSDLTRKFADYKV
jgi:GR25 family glycosyltransferase involved in LPS biosynthesis